MSKVLRCRLITIAVTLTTSNRGQRNSWEEPVELCTIIVLENARLLNNHILITDNMVMLVLVCASASISARITRCWYILVSS